MILLCYMGIVMQVIAYRDFYRPPSMIGSHRGFGRGWLSGTVSNGDMKKLDA